MRRLVLISIAFLLVSSIAVIVATRLWSQPIASPASNPASSNDSAFPRLSPAKSSLIASQLRALRSSVAMSCLQDQQKTLLIQAIDATSSMLAKGDAGETVRELGSLLSTAIAHVNGAPMATHEILTILQQALTDATADEASISDPLQALHAMQDLIQGYSLPNASITKLVDPLNNALTALSARDRQKELEQLAKVASTTTTLVTTRGVRLTAPQAAAILTQLVGVVNYFDPIPLISKLRDYLRADDIDGALTLVVTDRRRTMESTLNKLRSLRSNIDNVITTDLVLAFARGGYREYRMTATDSGTPKEYSVTFRSDCDGEWRLAQL